MNHNLDAGLGHIIPVTVVLCFHCPGPGAGLERIISSTTGSTRNHAEVLVRMLGPVMVASAFLNNTREYEGECSSSCVFGGGKRGGVQTHLWMCVCVLARDLKEAQYGACIWPVCQQTQAYIYLLSEGKGSCVHLCCCLLWEAYGPC